MAEILVIGGSGKVNAGPERLVWISLGSLGMAPAYGNIPGLAEILEPFFPADILHIIDTEAAIEFVFFPVVAPGFDPPGPIGINITGNCQVEIV